MTVVSNCPRNYKMKIKEAQNLNPYDEMDEFISFDDDSYDNLEDIIMDDYVDAGDSIYDDDSYADDMSYADDVQFVMPLIPGADEDGELEVADDDEELVVEVSTDPMDWKGRGMGNFIQWLYEMIDSCPKHSGKDTTGIERAISHFELLDREITKAMRVDFKGEIDSAKAEKAREQIQEGLKRLVDRLEKLKKNKFSKKGSEELYLTKEAKQERINGITVTVPLLISRIARVLVNGAISGGHNMERMFKEQVEQYDLTKREQAELAQLLEDMGYLYPGQLDRGFLIGEQGDRKSSDNYDLAANYPG